MNIKNQLEKVSLEISLRKVIQLHKRLNQFQYGVEVDGEIIDYENPRDFFNHYHYLSPEEFFRTKGGVCWDFAEAQYRFIKKLGFSNAINIYIELLDGDHDTHTFTLIKLKDRYIYIESSFEKIRGVYYSTHMKPIIDFVLNAMLSNEYKSKSVPYTVHAYTGYNNYGCDVITFMKYMREQKRLMRGVASYNSDIETPILLCESMAQLQQLFDDVYEEDVMFEAAVEHTFHFRDLFYKRISAVLDKPENKRKYQRIQNLYIERNMAKLATPGPQYLIVFGDSDQAAYFDLFGITKEEVQKAMIEVTVKANETSQFRFLRQNPILVVLYFAIRYFTLKNDKQAINSSLGIYALANYWSAFTKYFPKGVIAPVMEYTIDNMTDKFSIKRAGNVFNVLMMSIQQSYSFHKNRIRAGGDDDTVAFLQRIRNDQNSLMKKIANEYMKNYYQGNAVTTRNDDYDNDTPILDDVENASTIVSKHVSKVTLPIISNGVDLVFAEAAARMAGISISDCRQYLLKIIVPKNLQSLEELIESIIFIFIYTDKRNIRDIKSRYFLDWAESLFKKTNSKDPNLKRLNGTLEKWAEESGIYERFRRDASRINYKKGIFFYIILSIQKYS